MHPLHCRVQYVLLLGIVLFVDNLVRMIVVLRHRYDLSCYGLHDLEMSVSFVRKMMYLVLFVHVFLKVIDYKTQQSRLFPLLASAYAFRFVGDWLKWLYTDVTQKLQANDFSTLAEAHACTAGLKSLTTTATAVRDNCCLASFPFSFFWNPIELIGYSTKIALSHTIDSK